MRVDLFTMRQDIQYDQVLMVLVLFNQDTCLRFKDTAQVDAISLIVN